MDTQRPLSPLRLSNRRLPLVWVLAPTLIGLGACGAPEEPVGGTDAVESTTADIGDGSTTGEPSPTTSTTDDSAGDESSSTTDDAETTGANVAPDCDIEPLSFDEMIALMRTDVLTLDEDDRLNTRYVHLTDFHRAGQCGAELDRYRWGLSLLVNRLSRSNLIVKPTPIDEAETVYRVDVSDYNWDQNQLLDDVWEAIVERDGQAIAYVGDEIDDLVQETGTATPFMPVHGFIFHSARPPLYHDILEIPLTIEELEEDFLGVDVQAEIDAEDAAWAGFVESGVSQFNRLIQRYEVALGRTYWLSADFGNGEEFSNLFLHPVDFISGGGEMIFSLENGMQGYMVVDEFGERIDEAPTAVVSHDDARDNIVRTGVSCMDCHESKGIGIIPKADEVRDHVFANPDLFLQDLDLIDSLYVEKPEMDALQQLDQNNYRLALQQTGAPDNIDDPVFSISYDFEGVVDAAQAAVEFGVSEEFLAGKLVKLTLVEPQFAPLGIGGTVPRDTFDSAFEASLCVLAASENLPASCF